MHPLAFIGVFFALFSVRVIFVLISNLRSPLRDIPGPLLARFTRLWLFKELAHGHFEKTNIAIHKKYGKWSIDCTHYGQGLLAIGPIVRIAPNEYSIDDVDAARMIYGHGSRFPKSDWYVPTRQEPPVQASVGLISLKVLCLETAGSLEGHNVCRPEHQATCGGPQEISKCLLNVVGGRL